MIRVSTSDLRKNTADVLNKVAYGGERVACSEGARTLP